jgi:hypothetical protein
MVRAFLGAVRVRRRRTARAGCGIHLTMPMALPPPGADPRKGLTDREQANLDEQAFLQAQETGYQRIQGTKPQTLDYGLHDSPAGLAAWIAGARPSA